MTRHKKGEGRKQIREKEQKYPDHSTYGEEASATMSSAVGSGAEKLISFNNPAGARPPGTDGNPIFYR